MDDTDVPQAAITEVPATFGDGVVLLDVREDDEWQRGHAPDAQRVAQYLARNGYDPINVTGGMLAWAGAGRPVVTDDGSAGTV